MQHLLEDYHEMYPLNVTQCIHRCPEDYESTLPHPSSHPSSHPSFIPLEAEEPDVYIEETPRLRWHMILRNFFSCIL